MERNECIERAIDLLHFPPHEGYGRQDVLEVMKDLRLWKSDGADSWRYYHWSESQETILSYLQAQRLQQKQLRKMELECVFE